MRSLTSALVAYWLALRFQGFYWGVTYLVVSAASAAWHGSGYITICTAIAGLVLVSTCFITIGPIKDPA